MSKPQLLILNGPGFNYSGSNQEISSLSDIKNQCAKSCAEHELTLDFRQTDDIKQLLGWIHDDGLEADALIINPGINFQASHQLAVAVDELAQVSKPIIEVHLNNIFKQQQENKPLNITQGKAGFVSGLGISSYTLAINTIASTVRACLA